MATDLRLAYADIDEELFDVDQIPMTSRDVRSVGEMLFDVDYLARQLLMEHGNYPGIATHDPAMIQAARRFARERQIDVARFEFQMLYGVRRDLQQMLVKEGYNMRVYVPFGEAWYPYLMRRMAERPANMFFIVKAVVRESPLRHILPS